MYPIYTISSPSNCMAVKAKQTPCHALRVCKERNERQTIRDQSLETEAAAENCFRMEDSVNTWPAANFETRYPVELASMFKNAAHAGCRDLGRIFEKTIT
jgi:hypothetical protein